MQAGHCKANTSAFLSPAGPFLRSGSKGIERTCVKMTQGDRQALTRKKRSDGARPLAPEHNGRVHPHTDRDADLNTIPSSSCSFPWLSQCPRLPYTSRGDPSYLHMHRGALTCTASQLGEGQTSSHSKLSVKCQRMPTG